MKESPVYHTSKTLLIRGVLIFNIQQSMNHSKLHLVINKLNFLRLLILSTDSHDEDYP